MGYIAYFRVSTKKQGDSGLGLESQRAIVCHYVDCDDLAGEYVEVGSAKNVDGRPQLQQAIAQCKSEGHILIVAKLDRLSRKTEDALSIYAELDGRLASCDIPNLDKFTLTLFMAIADRERELISIRTKAALQAKKERGDWQPGTPENMTHQAQKKGAAVNQADATVAYRKLAGYVTLLREGGQSYQAIADTLNAEGHKTRRGGKFYAATVKRLADRAGIA